MGNLIPYCTAGVEKLAGELGGRSLENTEQAAVRAAELGPAENDAGNQEVGMGQKWVEGKGRGEKERGKKEEKDTTRLVVYMDRRGLKKDTASYVAGFHLLEENKNRCGKV